MKTRPIIFSGEMVRAILDGRKTQTRRVVKPQYNHQVVDVRKNASGEWCGHARGEPGIRRGWCTCPYGVPGDRLWVRETWAAPAAWDNAPPRLIPEPQPIWYRCTGSASVYQPGRWRPSIHMPRWASRITLEVLSVRVERVQGITEGDARAEGVGLGLPTEGLSCYTMFGRLWDTINAKRGYSWESNPWAWVVEFMVAP